MKTVRADSLASLSEYRLAEVEPPTPGADDAVIRVAACGLGYVDALVALGRYQVKPPVPFTPGQEVGGVVTAVGANVAHLAVGDRVLAAVVGGLAEQVRAPAMAVTPVPPSMSFAQAAGFRVNYVTALHGLRDRARLQPGERLVVFGAAGGVGAAAIQVGKLLGAQVIAVASTEAKRAFARDIGADEVLDTVAEGWRDRLKTVCGGKGPDVIFDPVCGPLFEPAFRSLVWTGRHLVVGFVGGPIPALPVNLPLMKGAALVGVDVRQFFLYEAAAATSHLDELLGWVGEGRLVPPVGKRFRLRDFRKALEFAFSGQGVGKPVVEFD
jgi:NADPH2:quinone reductase